MVQYGNHTYFCIWQAKASVQRAGAALWHAALWKACVLIARGAFEYENLNLQAWRLEYFEAAYPTVASVLNSVGYVDEVSNQDT